MEEEYRDFNIYKEDLVTVVTSPDLSKGYITKVTKIVEHEERPFIEEQWHYEVVREYDNGGKDVEKVIDVEGQSYRQAFTEHRSVKVYVEYTDTDIETKSLTEEMEQLLQELLETDYRTLKYIEGHLTEEEFNKDKEERQSKRTRIKEIEDRLGVLKEET